MYSSLLDTQFEFVIEANPRLSFCIYTPNRAAWEDRGGGDLGGLFKFMKSYVTSDETIEFEDKIIGFKYTDPVDDEVIEFTYMIENGVKVQDQKRIMHVFEEFCKRTLL